MFTVKHRAADGVETLHSAETIEVVQHKSRWEDGIYLDWAPPEPTPPDCTSPGYRAPPRLCIAITTPYDGTTPAQQVAGSADPRPAAVYVPRVWIMNETGATVASYDL